LPGDIRVENENGGFYFPIVTCILVSVVLSLILCPDTSGREAVFLN
jgi:hypothetical protein